MLTVRPFEERDTTAWDGYVRAQPGAPFGLLSAWMRVTERAYGCPARSWIAVGDGRVRGTLPLFLKRGPLSRSLFSAPGCHRVLLENLRDLGTPVRSASYYRAAAAALGEAAEVLVLEHRGRAAGAMFLTRLGDTVSDPWASSLRRFFALCPNQVLYWEAIRWGIARGAQWFDMGRSQWGSGTFRFKQQWGAAPVPLYYQYVLGRAPRVPTLEAQRRAFDLAVRLWRRLPLAVAAPLGERVKRLFPETL